MSAPVEPRSWLPGTLVLLIVVGLVFFLRGKLPVEEWLEPVRDWVAQFGVWGALVLGVAIVFSTAVGVPGSVMAIVAGLTLGMGRGLLTAWVGITAGCCLCFLLSGWIFGGRVRAMVDRRPQLVVLQNAVARRGGKVLLMMRLTPLVPLVVTNYVAGVSGVRFLDALWATALGILPATAVYVGLGAAGGGDPGRSAVLVGIGLVATIGLGILARRILSEVMSE